MNTVDNQVFISYASQDKERALLIYDSLKSDGFNAWIDNKNLLPGQNWDFEIRRALDKSVCILILISKNSFNKRGYVQREIKFALDKLSEMLVDDIYIIPILLDDISLPEQLSHLQSIKISESGFSEKIKSSIKYQLVRLGKLTQELQRKEDIYWAFDEITESWDGLPGYNVELKIPSFHSKKYADLSQIGEYIKGKFIEQLFQHRHIRFSQSTRLVNYGQNEFRGTSTYDAQCREPIIRGKVLSIQYSVHWYGAGAAHPNLHFETFNFVLEPLVLIPALSLIFENLKDVFPVLQRSIRNQLYTKLVKADISEEEAAQTRAWIDRGTSDWKHFHSFIFGLDGIEVMLPPYEVASYADGAHFTEISYSELAKFMRPEYREALLLQGNPR